MHKCQQLVSQWSHTLKPTCLKAHPTSTLHQGEKVLVKQTKFFHMSESTQVLDLNWVQIQWRHMKPFLANTYPCLRNSRTSPSIQIVFLRRFKLNANWSRMFNSKKTISSKNRNSWSRNCPSSDRQRRPAGSKILTIFLFENRLPQQIWRIRCVRVSLKGEDLSTQVKHVLIAGILIKLTRAVCAILKSRLGHIRRQLPLLQANLPTRGM